MSRLADYFAVVGYDHEKDRSGISTGKLLQRFPEKDWDDCPFMVGLPLFCQPMGWSLHKQRRQPSFYVAVLTDMDGERHYCAVFTFMETVGQTTQNKAVPDDTEEEEHEGNLVIHRSSMFAPKSMVLMSRHDYFEAFRNCLGIIYTVHLENMPVKIETLVGNILGCVQVPPSGGPQVRFSIGAGDRQALQPPLSPTLPISHTSVAILFEQLGINNTLLVFSSALTDHKILFYSESCSRLCDASRALAALLYPLKYSYVFIPVLPTSLLEVLNSPTPLVAGVHATLKDEITDLLDVITVDLDGGSVKVPECVTVPPITEDVLVGAKTALTMILNPELFHADYAFTPSPRKAVPLVQRDKELRAVFIRMFAELFSGYRSSLAVVRIHPTPFITFHKVRNCLKFTNLHTASFFFLKIYETLLLGQSSIGVSHRAFSNTSLCPEFPNQQPYVPKVPKPTEGAYARIHQPVFPDLDSKMIQDIIDEGLGNGKKLNNIRPQQMRIVPMGMHLGSWSLQRTLENNTRRLEVLRSCVGFIFDNKISDARIIFPAVLRALKSGAARLALTQELGDQVKGNRAMLEHQQFELVVKLLNCALLNDSNLDEHGVAAAIVPLATTFCRKLCTGVLQFAYTLIQEHAVWGSQQFWEQAFYEDVQQEIRRLYLPLYEEHMLLMSKSTDSSELNPSDNIEDRSSTLKPRQIGPLEIAAEQLRIWPTLSSDEKSEMINNEESTVYSQAIHYANRMVYLRVPLDVSRNLKTLAMDENSSTVTPSVAESDSLDAESGFDESEQTDVAAVVTKFVSRFVDKVCNDAGVLQKHVKDLHQMIPGVVAMHIETLEAVNRESKRLPPVQKPKILQPVLLPGEEMVIEGLRVYLMPDGREEGTGNNMGGPTLLPAQGAVFLTSYRVIFKGMPCDPYACEQPVIRSFPVSSLTKEKKISVQLYLSHLEQGLSEVLQLRSTVFQLMKIAFDEEVGSDNIEMFRKLVNRFRNPPTVFSTFAFTGHTIHASTQMQKGKEKNASLRQFAKRTFLKTARKAGLKKQSRKPSKTSLTSPPVPRRGPGNHSPRSSDSESEYAGSIHQDDLSVIDENEFIPSYATDPKNVERMMERHAYEDYQRLGLGSVAIAGHRGAKSEPFRVSTVNATYKLCQSYPGLLVVPQTVSDDSIRKIARCNRLSRFPVITWRHPRTKSLLLRASGFHSRNPMGMLRHNTASASSGGEASSSIEQEKYFQLLVAATPMTHRNNRHSRLDFPTSDSFSSLDSLMMVGVEGGLGGDSLKLPVTPEMPRHAKGGKPGEGSALPVDKRVSAPASALGAANRIGSLRGDRSPHMSHRHTAPGSHLGAKGDPDHGELISNSIKRLHQTSLYVLGEKAQMKGIKSECFPKCDFIPVDFYEVRQVKTSFKKLMRACVPSNTPTNQEQGFLKAVEESEWLPQLQSILQLSGAVVDLLDVQGSSVMVCLEEGWDITSQVVSVAQVLADPHYRTMEGFETLVEKEWLGFGHRFRTMEGFETLVEKEWLGFGHRFSHRNNQTAATQTSGFAPIFLQFLDAVHQIHCQFPLSFEFSQYYLRYLAYHCVSNRFRTFMLDSELERVESGWLLDDQLKPSTHWSLSPSAVVAGNHAADRSPAEHSNNSHHLPSLLENRPYSNVSNLKIWDFFTTEDLHRGAPYDLDLEEGEGQGEELEAEAMGVTRRRTLNACYHNIMLQQPDFFWAKAQELNRLEGDLGMKQSSWRDVYDRLECPGRDQFHRQVSFNTQQVRSHGRSFHKKATLEILLRGKMLGETARIFSQPHRFEKHTYTTSTFCDYCHQMLWGLSKTGFRCSDCGYNCHDKCLAQVPKNCQKLLKSVGEASISSSHLAGNGRPVTDVHETEQSTSFENYTTTPKTAEHRTHEGYLCKQGAFFKQWKQRWFVLDSMQHQLRYYESAEDGNSKRHIDLAEVESVNLIKSVPGAPKRAVENSFIEISTVRRVYNLMAGDAKIAQDWVEKLQGCLQRD
ncbi:hypothetical protein EGW08_020336 [Elysia chlorotica]|uniref:Myotubularin-related protein 13 n=1 Tax=Elysia chlorotica TaxID=188477 RepID=A0A3S1ATT4_ELYCH|nr:hypothetical protein EGW08_020336 [Elysia chlorotica]